MSSTTLYPVADTYVDQNNPTVAADQSGSVAKLVVFANLGTGKYIHTWIRFDLSSIPAGSTINSASLKMWMFYIESSNYSGGQIDVYDSANITWAETITWNTQPSTRTAIVRNTVGNPFGTEITFNVAAAVTAGLVSGGMSLRLNHVVEDLTSVQNEFRFQDDDYTTGPPANRYSKLVVDYTAPAGGSTTTMIGLMEF